MYAAAAGASLGSRQARKQQRQQNSKNRALLQQGLKDKLAAAKAPGIATPTKSRPFHQLPANYLRTPNAQARKLSASYAQQGSKLLLPISESKHNDVHQQHQRQLSPTTPTCHYRGLDERRRQNQLIKSATATLPLVSQTCQATPPSTPTVCFSSNFKPPQLQQEQSTGFSDEHPSVLQVKQQQREISIAVPFSDPIIITPATPLASPGPPSQLERKCSVYRARKLDGFEDDLNKTTTIKIDDPYNDEPYMYDPMMPNGGHKWTAAPEICDSENRHIGICTCDHLECAQGRAAWLERGRRCSVQENAASCHRRWVKRNRIHDSSLGGSSDDEDLLGVLRGPSSFANAFLYVGLGTVAIGLVISFVGTGEKGFKTVELRLIGPSLIGIGLICCILRIFFCICPSHCISASRKARNKKNAKVDADHTTSLLRGDSKRVQIARGPNLQPKNHPQIHKSISKPNSKTIEGMEALRHIATTSLFLQNEQKITTNRIVPIIKEPERLIEEPLEMNKIDCLSIDIYSLSDEEDENDVGACGETDVVEHPADREDTEIEPNEYQNPTNKLLRQRAPVNQTSKLSLTTDPDILLMETSLMIVNPSPLPTTSTLLSPPPIPPQQQHSVASSKYHHSTSTSIHLQPPPQQQYDGLTLSLPGEPELVLSPAKLGQ